MKPGDLVKCHSEAGRDVNPAGIIIEVADEFPGTTCNPVFPTCKVLWSSGDIDKEWRDELEVIHEAG